VSGDQIMRECGLRAALLGLAAALVLSSCGAGQNAQTSTQVAGVNGASGEIGSIALRDVVLAYPGGERVFGYGPGDVAPLLATIVNSGDRADELVSVTTPAAGAVIVVGTTTIPGGVAVTSLDDAGTASALEPPTPEEADPLRPADPPLAFDELIIVLTNLQQPIRPGRTTAVTFRFRHAGQMTLPVPIEAPAETREEPAENSPPGDE